MQELLCSFFVVSLFCKDGSPIGGQSLSFVFRTSRNGVIFPSDALKNKSFGLGCPKLCQAVNGEAF